MYQIIKRDGNIAEFDINKIAAAIKKAFEATDTEYTENIIDFLSLKVTADFLPKIKDGYIAVEDIQDSVEAVLPRGGYESVATHQTAMPYIEKAWDSAMVLLRGVMALLFPAGT